MAVADRRLLGLLFAVVGLTSQLALGSMVLPDLPSPTDRLAALSVMCRTGRPSPPQPAHHAPDQAACPLGLALALPSVVPVPAPFLPPPSAATLLRAGRTPPPRAPPAAAVAAAQPRGPPRLS